MESLCGTKQSQIQFNQRVVLRHIRILSFPPYLINVNWLLVACMIPYDTKLTWSIEEIWNGKKFGGFLQSMSQMAT